MKTNVTQYRFDSSNPEDLEQYQALKAKLTASGHHFFNVIASGKRFEYSGPLELETAPIFADQWNSASIPGYSETGWRVFDWYEGIYPNKKIHWGYYLDLTDEMRAVRDETYSCGYCGHQELTPTREFCGCCIDSEYLEEKDLHLTRLRPVSDKGNRAPLTEGERAELLPKFIDAKIHGATERGKARIEKKRVEILRQRDRDIKNATDEYDGFIWLMDRGLNIDNAIYYGHTGKFCFGWRTPLTGTAAEPALLKALESFPFPYEVK